MMGMLRRGPNSASPEVRVKSRAHGKLSLARDERGSSLVEFALVSTFVMFPLLLGIIVFGIAFSNQLTLTNAANTGAQVMAVSRNNIGGDLCTAVNSAVYPAASTLTKTINSQALQFTLQVYSTPTAYTSYGPVTVVFASTGGPTCSGAQAALAQGKTAAITMNYGCSLAFFGVNFAPNCKLTAQAAEVVQ